MIRSHKGITPVVPSSCYVDESAQVIGDVVLAENASIWPCAVLRGDVNSIRIGANSNIQDCSVLHGQTDLYRVELGEWVTVGHRAMLHGCTIEDRCVIGIGAIVLNGARIGHDSIIAAGTLIPENAVVEPGSLMMGSPGKLRRALGDKDRERILWNARNYIVLREQYLKESTGRMR
jgi:carbonic anhydrase/acetyltransferase-like protein (isoleucine patch superfamily)